MVIVEGMAVDARVGIRVGMRNSHFGGGQALSFIQSHLQPLPLT